MTRRAGIRSLVLAGSILLAVLVAVWLGARRTGHSIDEANTIEPAGGPSMPRPGSTGGVRRLQIDPAMPSLEWRREGFDEPEPSFVALNDALRSIAGTTDAAALEELLAMLAWTMPFGQDGEVGLAISECAKRFEPQLAEACRWDMDFVVERTAGDLGELRVLGDEVEQRLRDIRRLDIDDASPLFRYNEMYAQHELREFERMLAADPAGND